MMNRSKLVAALLALLAVSPALSAGRPACCIKPAAASAASHGCCHAMGGAQVAAPKGCCKAPVAPKPETKVTDGAPIALSVPVELGAPALASAALSEAVSTRLARRAHHADAPDDSPPDLLSRIRVLLI
jgi:hypothetical protein